MKILFNRLNSLAILFVIATFVACEKTDISEEKIGIENVYIPQSISASTTDNNYRVPGNINFGAAKNYKNDEAAKKVLVFLGVSKSGKADTQPFTVNLTSRPDTINQLILNGADFVLLPSTAYTLPASISLAAGQSSVGFNLVVDKPILKTYVGKKVAVCVELANPTRYDLEAQTKKVIIIIDVDALNLE